MGDNSKIEWTSSTWNPIRARNLNTGDEGWFCIHVSDGCKNCYAETMNVARPWGRGTGLAYKAQNLKHHEIFLDEKTLSQPLRWKKSRKIFVCSMTDLFAEFVPFEFIDKVFAVMALAPQHTFQILTKRPERMAEYLNHINRRLTVAGVITSSTIPHKHIPAYFPEWPLKNVWLGTSVENQTTADERIPHLLRCPAVVRWLSCEPLLGPMVLCGGCACGQSPLYGGHINPDQTGKPCKLQKLDWIVVGGESGPKARPMDVAWPRALMRQCKAAGVAFFFKQGSERNWIRYKDFDRFPADLQVRQYPTAHHEIATPPSAGGSDT